MEKFELSPKGIMLHSTHSARPDEKMYASHLRLHDSVYTKGLTKAKLACMHLYDKACISAALHYVLKAT